MRHYEVEEARSAFSNYEDLAVLYLTAGMPRWLSRILGVGMLNALAKEAPQVVIELAATRKDPNEAFADVDARPSKAEDLDTSVACKALARLITQPVRDAVKPEQLSVGAPGSTTTMAIGVRERIEEAKRSGKPLLVVGADISNAHNEFCREHAQESIMEMAASDTRLVPLIRAHAVLADTNSPIYARDPTKHRPRFLTYSCAPFPSNLMSR